MRKSNSIKNIIISILMNSLNILLNFFVQKVFINYLGIEYNGLNGILTNIINMLATIELGLGSAIIFHMYNPLAKSDIATVKKLLAFYKKCYFWIGISIFSVGLLFMPFLTYFINSESVNVNIYLVYLLFLLENILYYFIAHRKSLVYAMQKNRTIDFIHIMYILFLNLIQIYLLVNYKNYYVILLLKIIMRILENTAIYILTQKKYSNYFAKTNEKLEKNIVDDIKIKVKGLIFHQIGGFVVLGTDNLLMSKFFGLVVSGIYSNYYMIVNAANLLLSQFFLSLTPSVGNLLIENDIKKNYQIYVKLFFINFCVFALGTYIFVFLANDFISIWIGKNYLFDISIVFAIAINFFMQGMRKTMQVFASAAGICYENRFVPLCESVINIIFSLLLIKIFGISGIVYGTIISTLFLFFYGFPKYIYTPMFKKRRIDFIKDFLLYLLSFIICLFILNILFNYIRIDNIIILMIIKCILTCIIFIIYLFVVYRKKMLDCFDLLKSMLLNKKKR